jgi:hypothetical protein
MEQGIQLYGFLVLTFLGVTAPILVILLSVFEEGRLKLTTQYENERSQSEKNIKEQLKKLTGTEETDVTEIKQSLKSLEIIKKTAEAKLSYLNPKKQMFQLYIPFLISFLGVILAILSKANVACVRLYIAVSLICFSYALVVLWKLTGTIIEVKKSINDGKKDMNMKIIKLLSALVKKEDRYFLKDIYITIDDKKIEDNTGEITISADKKQELKIGIDNIETRMAKNVEIGFTFPPDFVIEKTSSYSIYTTKTKQIVRYVTSLIQGKTNLILDSLIITPLKKGDYKIKTFIKAENIKSVSWDLNLKVTEKPLPEIVKEILTEQQKGGQ